MSSTWSAIAIVITVCASPFLSVADEKQPVIDGVGTPGDRTNVYISEPRSVLTSDKSRITLQYVLERKVANSERFHTAAGDSVERASQRLAETIDDHLRDRVGTTAAGAAPANLTAITNAVIAASRDNASQLGIQIVNLRLSEQKYVE